jgi:hypothetical protein
LRIATEQRNALGAVIIAKVIENAPAGFLGRPRDAVFEIGGFGIEANQRGD